MDIAINGLIIGGILFLLGLISLFALASKNKKTNNKMNVKNSSGIFISGNDNQNISANITQTPATETVTKPIWHKLMTALAWIAAIAGPIIAALSYWYPPSGA